MIQQPASSSSYQHVRKPQMLVMPLAEAQLMLESPNLPAACLATCLKLHINMKRGGGSQFYWMNKKPNGFEARVGALSTHLTHLGNSSLGSPLRLHRLLREKERGRKSICRYVNGFWTGSSWYCRKKCLHFKNQLRRPITLNWRPKSLRCPVLGCPCSLGASRPCLQ